MGVTELKQRIITGVIAAVIFLTLLLIGKLPYALAIGLLAVVGFYEFINMHRLPVKSFSAAIGFSAILFYVIPWNDLLHIDFKLPAYHVSIWFIMLLFLVLTVVTKNKLKLEQVAIYMIGIIYIGLGTHYMAATRLLEDGLFWTFFIFVCIWVSDIGAYFSGLAVGKHLLWPAISPKKTIEGAIGAIIFTMIAALLFALWQPDKISMQWALMVGLIISITAQFGDLIQSAYKRVCGVKDSGNFLPGHGGILDRIDSWLIVFPFLHLLSLLPL